MIWCRWSQCRPRVVVPLSFSRFYSPPPRTKKPPTETIDPFKLLGEAGAMPAETEELDLDRLDWSHLDQPQRKDATEQFSATAPPRNEQREEMIFKEVLGNVLSSPTRTRANADSAADTSPLSSSILALFDRGIEARRASQQPTSVTSLLDGITGSSKSVAAMNSEWLKKRERAEKALVHVFARIDACETNRDVMLYFEQIIVPRFSESHHLSDSDPPLSAEDPLVGPETVSYVLERCISTLAGPFDDPVGALHLFELSKRHSIEFFAESCSADVYNEVIRIRWNTYRDLYAVVNLAAEIAINAIPPNLGTTEIMSTVYREAADSASGFGATAHALPLWTGQDEKRLEELNRYRARFQSAWASRPVLRF